ncbi:MAG: hypothetical protein QM493_03090 [Sulfurovum sp.]
MIYGLIVFISIVASIMGFISESIVCNITHIKNGRNPEAGNNSNNANLVSILCLELK